jgi:hypothetical protein
MNAIQGIDEKEYGHVFATSNPPVQPETEKTIGTYLFDHPQLDANVRIIPSPATRSVINNHSKAIHAQGLLPSIQNTRGISYAGAWVHYGFHEDGLTAGLLAVTKYSNLPDVVPPFEILEALPCSKKVTMASRAFSAFERSGLRMFVGTVGSTALAALNGVIRLGVLGGGVVIIFAGLAFQ